MANVQKKPLKLPFKVRCHQFATVISGMAAAAMTSLLTYKNTLENRGFEVPEGNAENFFIALGIAVVGFALTYLTRPKPILVQGQPEPGIVTK